ncbi:MAG TPA: zf-HC2 domain-containing protein [Bryobacteraceae bacterium]|nr:zf-HC2 domain-containing protein [Bryobacteraceae bacterium]
MDHETAIRLQAAERYVARALSESERDEFEEHFFECAECAEEVRWEQIFVANAREVFREQTQRPPRPAAAPEPVAEPRRAGGWFSFGWLRPAFALSAFANVALLLVGGYEFLEVMPRLRAQLETLQTPQLTAAISVPTIVRAEPKLIQVPSSMRLIPLSFALPHRFPKYQYEVAREDGMGRFGGSVPSPAATDEELLLSVPAARLTGGAWRVSLRGIEGSSSVEIGSCRLQVGR